MPLLCKVNRPPCLRLEYCRNIIFQVHIHIKDHVILFEEVNQSRKLFKHDFFESNICYDRIFLKRMNHYLMMLYLGYASGLYFMVQV